MRTDKSTSPGRKYNRIIVIDGVQHKRCPCCSRMLELQTNYYYNKSQARWRSYCKKCICEMQLGSEQKRRKQEWERRKREWEQKLAEAEAARKRRLEMQLKKAREAREASRQAENVRRIKEALAKVAAMKEEKRKKEEAEEAERMMAKKRSKPDPVPVKKPKRRLEPTDEPCKHCKSFSPISGHKLCQQGFCLKHRRTEHAENTCGDFRPNIKIKYVI